MRHIKRRHRSKKMEEQPRSSCAACNIASDLSLGKLAHLSRSRGHPSDVVPRLEKHFRRDDATVFLSPPSFFSVSRAAERFALRQASATIRLPRKLKIRLAFSGINL